jgi:hypothetical protein
MNNDSLDSLLQHPLLNELLATTIAKTLEAASARNISNSASSALTSDSGSSTKLDRTSLYKFSNEELAVCNM